VRAALLDALGTLVELERPWPHLVAELGARGATVSEDEAKRAMLAEMAYYKANHDDASDVAGLEDLRRRCAEVVRGELGVDLPVAEVEAAMLAAIRFRPYP
jgi:putative hydrolase of the HAD superfamily